MINFFVGLIVFMVLAGLTWWISGPEVLAVPDKMRKILMVVLVVAFVLYALSAFGFIGGFAGGGGAPVIIAR